MGHRVAGDVAGPAARGPGGPTGVAEKARELEAANISLRDTNEDLDQFAAVASHDLQAPVRQIMSFMIHLKNELGDGISDGARSDLDFIERAAERMNTLTDGVLRIARAGRTPLDKQVVALDDCVDAALEALTETIESTGAAIERDPLPTVLGDRTLLGQVFQNLIGNALKFHGDSPPRVRVTCVTDGTETVFGVQDRGSGVDPAEADQRFKPFTRSARTSEISGSGVGLSVCRKAAMRHGGRIWVEPTPGGGAHFRFTLGVASTVAAGTFTPMDSEVSSA